MKTGKQTTGAKRGRSTKGERSTKGTKDAKGTKMLDSPAEGEKLDASVSPAGLASQGARARAAGYRYAFETAKAQALDEDTRTATFVLATENPVKGWDGLEYRDMGGVRLERFRANPVVLDAHDRFSVGRVIGRAEISREHGSLLGRVTFAKTARATEIWELVRDDFVRAVSIGFNVHNVQQLEAGEFYGDKERGIVGPGVVFTDWELFESSIVPVGADADALKRNGMDGGLVALGAPVSRALRGLLDEIDACRRIEERIMAKQEDAGVVPQEDGVVEPVAATTAPAVKSASASAVTLRADLLAICPKGLEAEAEQCVLEELSFEDARKRLAEKNAARLAAVGTPEPEEVVSSAGEGGGPLKVADVPDDVFLRGLGA